MENHTYKQAQDILKGDKVITVDESFNQIVSEIECVVQTDCPENELLMVQLDGGLTITPWHPIFDADRSSWEFPVMMGEPEMTECPAVYTFVTANRKPVIVNDYIFSTFGHGLKGEVIEHEFFGTGKVINDLMNLPNYENGIVYLSPSMFKRGYDGKVCNIVHGVEYFANL